APEALLVAANIGVAVLRLVALAVLVVPVELAGGLALGELVRAIAERQILRQAAGANPLRFDARLHFVGVVAVALHDPSHVRSPFFERKSNHRLRLRGRRSRVCLRRGRLLHCLRLGPHMKILASLALVASIPALAQPADYPSRPIHILVGLTPAGGPDSTARWIAAERG